MSGQVGIRADQRTTNRTRRYYVNSAVYVARCGDFIKIGLTTNVEKRIKALTGAMPFNVELIASFQGNWDFEQALHNRFAVLHHRNEWFHCKDELAAWIEGGCKL